MKNKLICALSVVFFAWTAEARIIQVNGMGRAEAINGHTRAACELAGDRAYNNAETQCDRRDGDIVNANEGACRCRLHPHSQDDYTCHVALRAACRVD